MGMSRRIKKNQSFITYDISDKLRDEAMFLTLYSYNEYFKDSLDKLEPNFQQIVNVVGEHFLMRKNRYKEEDYKEILNFMKKVVDKVVNHPKINKGLFYILTFNYLNSVNHKETVKELYSIRPQFENMLINIKLNIDDKELYKFHMDYLKKMVNKNKLNF